MKLQQTVAAETVISGKALHCGAAVEMRILPQPENTGIIFRRSDLQGKPQIKAHISAIVDTRKSTTIGKDGWKISTIEHLMAVFHGLNIDNALVEVDGEELPSGDCSGLYFSEEILKNGIAIQDAPRNYVMIKEPVWVEGNVNKQGEPSKAMLIALPGETEGIEISFTFTSDHKVTGTQHFHFSSAGNNFINDIAPARTIAFMREIEYLQSQGLALGGDINSVVIVGDEAYQNELRFPEEIVRHKILDILGDLYLLGPLSGHIIAIRSGHSLNWELAKKIHDKIKVKQGDYHDGCE